MFAHILALVVTYYTAVLVPLLHVATHVNVVPLIEGPTRALVEALPAPKVTYYMYTDLGSDTGKRIGHYEFYEPDYEGCTTVPLFEGLGWPTYAVCDLDELWVADLVARHAAALEAPANAHPSNSTSPTVGVVTAALDDEDGHASWRSFNAWHYGPYFEGSAEGTKQRLALDGLVIVPMVVAALTLVACLLKVSLLVSSVQR